jgi:regulatory protein
VIITAVERNARRRARVDVYIDGERRFDVSRELAKSRGLLPGRTIDAAAIYEIVAADQRKRAMDAATSMLARRPRSEREVRRRLGRGRFPSALIEETVARLHELKLIDDTEFARSWAESRDHFSPRGRRLMVQELRARGVDADTARGAVLDLDDADAAYRLASRRARSLAALGYDTFRSRLASLLQRRGFGWEAARAAIDQCWRECGGPPTEDDRAEAMG